MKCKKCKIEMKEGKALQNTLSWGDDFGGESKAKEPPKGVTCSYSGPPVMKKVNKCPDCGHSVTH